MLSVWKIIGILLFGMLLGCETSISSDSGPSVGNENGLVNDDGEDTERDEMIEWDPTQEVYLQDVGGRFVMGWVEWSKLMQQGLWLKAKLDSGAKTSSLNALELTEFERDGDDWVRFFVVDPETEEKIKIERPVSRWLRIVQHKRDPQRRPVVKIPVKVGSVEQEVEFSLVDRSKFTYQILIGRNFLKGRILIDSDETFLSGKGP